ncbi:MAG: DNA mismatch repair endonuclease MutL [Bacteroidota bacterium]|nr:DNA mismatch repair endonuclease MutL [Bacteroidota bacterium]
MLDIIHLLPENIANQIAAGEVVQRPQSVVKELLENSLDAGAGIISLRIKDAGKTLIQVTDDGMGMSDTDALMCFERHATSKIRELNDLYQINSFGFRGEAMASIAAVSSVELTTGQMGSNYGTYIRIEGGFKKNHEPAPPKVGTQILVKNLFFNTPARRKFLKSDAAETKAIFDEFVRVALSSPQVEMHLFRDDEQIYFLKAGKLSQRISSLFGKRYENALIPVQEQIGEIQITGYIGKPELARKTKGEQFIYANSRYIRHIRLHYAVLAAYSQLLQNDVQPFYVLNIEINPQNIDINVHPTKTEIKFEDENMIYALVSSAVRRSLGQYHTGFTLDFEQDQLMINSKPDPSKELQMPSIGTMTEGYNPFKKKATPQDWKDLLSILNHVPDAAGTNVEASSQIKDVESLMPASEDAKPVIQLNGTYIVTTIRSGLLLIHQQYAHERILYEKYLHKQQSPQQGNVPVQQAMFPQQVDLPISQVKLLEPILPTLLQLGYDLQLFGQGSILIAGTPADYTGGDYREMIEVIIDELLIAGKLDAKSKVEVISRALARNNAIKTGTPMVHETMRMLIDQLFACQLPELSPKGLPAILTIPHAEIEQRFKR